MEANHVLTIVVGLAVLYFRSYLNKKAENLATKEDLAEITRKVESVRAEYAEKLQTVIHENTLVRDALDRRHQLGMAALDKRLQAHQTAYYLWREILIKFQRKDDNSAFFEKCDIWWAKHCLYLSPEAEKAFRAALRLGHAFKAFQGTVTELKAFESITSAGDVIRKAAQLPPLPQDELVLPSNREAAANSPVG